MCACVPLSGGGERERERKGGDELMSMGKDKEIYNNANNNKKY